MEEEQQRASTNVMKAISTIQQQKAQVPAKPIKAQALPHQPAGQAKPPLPPALLQAAAALPSIECREFHRHGTCPYMESKGHCAKQHTEPPLCKRPNYKW